MIWMLTNFTNFFHSRKAWAIACASCLVALSGNANADVTQAQVQQAVYDAIFQYLDEMGVGGPFPSVPFTANEGGEAYEPLNWWLERILVNGQGNSWLQWMAEWMGNHSFTNDLGQVETYLESLERYAQSADGRFDDLLYGYPFQGMEYDIETVGYFMGIIEGWLSAWDHDGNSSKYVDAYVVNLDEAISVLTGSIADAVGAGVGDATSGQSAFPEIGPTYTNSQDTIEARYKYGGDSVSNSVGYLGAVEGLDGLLDPLHGVAQSVSIDELPELPIPSGSSVITFWSGLEIADAEIPDAVVDVAEVLDAGLRADIRNVLSVVYSLACGFLLFKRGLREYKYYASLGQTEGEE